MPSVDYERAWLEFKAVIVEKNSHGKRDLLREMAEIEVACMVPEGQQGYDPTPRSTGSANGRSREVAHYG